MEEIQRLARIVEMFLSSARPVKLDLKPTRLGGIFEQVIELLGPECEHHHITLCCESDSDLPMLLLDSQQMYQVVLNLAKNAVEAVSAAMGSARNVTLRSRLESDHVLIEVSDTGRGIPEEDRGENFRALLHN